MVDRVTSLVSFGYKEDISNEEQAERYRGVKGVGTRDTDGDKVVTQSPGTL